MQNSGGWAKEPLPAPECVRGGKKTVRFHLGNGKMPKGIDAPKDSNNAETKRAGVLSNNFADRGVTKKKKKKKKKKGPQGKTLKKKVKGKPGGGSRPKCAKEVCLQGAD